MAAFLSGSKGGTGKTTLCTLTAIELSRRSLDVLIIDLGESGNATSLLTRGVEPPYFTDYLAGKAQWGDTIVEVREHLYLAPTPPDFSLAEAKVLLGSNAAALERYSEFLAVMADYVDVVYLDFPAFPFKSYGHLLSPVDTSVLVINPDPLSFAAALHTYTGSSYVLPVLNKYHPAASYWRDTVEDSFNNVVIIPFDVTLSFLVKESIFEAERYLESDTRKALAELAEKLARPGGKRVQPYKAPLQH